MKKNIILLGAIVFSSMAFSQVGVNTVTPKTTMDISSKRDGAGVLTDNTKAHGLQAPRLTRAELTDNTATYAADQIGAIIYITDISGGTSTGQREFITAIGYYYFDGSKWQKVSTGASGGGADLTDDAFINDATNTMVKLGTKANGTTARDANTDFVIKDDGKVGVGTASPTHPLHVAGKMRATNLTNGAAAVSTNDLGLYNQTSGFYNRYVTNSGDHRWYIDGVAANSFSGGANAAMILSFDGLLGIGKYPTPNVKLDVDGNINAVDEIFIKRNVEGGQLKLQGQATTDWNWTIDQVNIGTPANARFRIFAGSDEKNGIAIKQDGNMGVNTAVPNSKLVVEGSYEGAYREVSNHANLDINDQYVNAVGGSNYFIRLPNGLTTTTQSFAGRIYIIKNTTNNDLTLAGSDSTQKIRTTAGTSAETITLRPGASVKVIKNNQISSVASPLWDIFEQSTISENETQTLTYARSVTSPIDGGTPSNSVVSIGNLRVRYNGTSSTVNGYIEYQAVVPSHVTNIYHKAGSGGTNLEYYGTQAAETSQWYKLRSQTGNGLNDLNPNNRDLSVSHVIMHNTKEVYRITSNANGDISASGGVPAVSSSITLFVEKLSL